MKNKLLKIFILLLIIIPINTYAYSNKIIVSGKNIGIEVNTKEIIVVGFYKVNNKNIAKDSGFLMGDRIIKVNNNTVESIDDMVDKINSNIINNKVEFTVLRNNKEQIINLNIVKDKNGVYKTGLYVKNQITGVGTLTYIDPNSKIFGALGHEILESSTKTKIDVKDGSIYYSKVTGITKSTDNSTGEKNAVIDKNIIYGNINKNTISGIFGKYTDDLDNGSIYEISNPEDIVLGEAYILSEVDNKIDKYTINIIKINKGDTKNILFEITDKRLINKTNGIVKGMSGSPIIQNNKVIGAVTHAIVNDNIKGYGIFITTMLKEGEKQE